MFKAFYCTFDCKPSGLHLERGKKTNNSNKKKNCQKTNKNPTNNNNKKENNNKNPHEKARSETKPRNFILAVLKAYSVPVWDGPKDFPAGLVFSFNYWQILLMGTSIFGPKLIK